MKKNLYLLGAMMISTSLFAQQPETVVKYGFEGNEVFGIDGTGWTQYENFYDDWLNSGGVYETENSEGFTGKCLYISSPTTNNTWERGFRLRNIEILPNTSYRLSYWIKGTDGVRVQTAFMCGESNADMPFVADGTDQGRDYVTYSYDVDGIDGAWQYVSKIFYFSNQEKQEEFFSNFKADAELPAGYFTTMNLYSEGEYYLDDIEIVKTTVAGITFNDDVIRVDFGYDTNIANLAKSTGSGVYEYDPTVATVTDNGTPLKVSAVEAHKDGYLYIFLGDDKFLTSDDNGNIVVSFTNPKDVESTLYYTTLKSPYPWGSEEVKYVYSFENETAYFNGRITDVMSQEWTAPKLISSNPDNKSFELPLDIKEFSFTFHKKVDLAQIKAHLNGPVVEVLNIKNPEGLEFNETAVFERSGSSDLTLGDYYIQLSDIFNEAGIDDPWVKPVIEFSAGVDPEATTDIDSVFYDNFILAAEGDIPPGWICSSDNGDIRYPGASGGGSRMFEFAEGGISTRAFYFRTNEAKAALEYGNYTDESTGESYEIDMKAGKIQATYWANQWASTRSEVYVDFEIMKKSTMEVVYTKRDTVTNENMQGEARGAGNKLKEQQRFSSTIIIPADDKYIVKITLPLEDNGGSWASLLLSKIQIETVPSEAAYYKALIKGALDDATTQLTNCADPNYAGTSYDALQSLVNKYTGVVYHSPAAYMTAVDELEAGITVLKTRKSNVDTYISNLESAITYLSENVGKKYEKDPSFKAMSDIYTKYVDVAATELNDSDLSNAANEISTQYTISSNSIKCIDALTKAHVFGAQAAEKLEAEDLASISKAYNTITDDDVVRAAINKAITGAWYKAASENKNIDPATGMIGVYNEIEEYYDNDSVNLSSFIINPNLYTTSTGWSFNNETFPGWETYNIFNEPDTIWNEDNTSYVLDERIWRPATSGPVCGGTASATSPVVDVAIYNNGTTGMILQKIEGLPAGIYNFSVDGSNTNDTPEGERVFWLLVEGRQDTLKADFPIARHWALQPAAVLGVELKGESVIIGTKEAFASPEYATGTDNFSIRLVGKAKDFNYQEAYINSIDELTSESPIIAIKYYDINGIEYSKAVPGVNIMKIFRMDGSIEVKKAINK